MVDDLPLSADTDLAGATLVLANRDIDLQGNAPDDLDALAPIHGAPESQKKHCLRAPSDDEPDGSATTRSIASRWVFSTVRERHVLLQDAVCTHLSQRRLALRRAVHEVIVAREDDRGVES